MKDLSTIRTPRGAPVYIMFMLTIYTSPNPEKELGEDHWNSPVGQEVRAWLDKHKLIAADGEKLVATPKGRAWIAMICETPLPAISWSNPLTNELIEPY